MVTTVREAEDGIELNLAADLASAVESLTASVTRSWFWYVQFSDEYSKYLNTDLGNTDPDMTDVVMRTDQENS